ncbi:hypothetical protein FB45DRAFT_482069 [Roridomyces roridus]|uniref:Uncharacterized protein n=1 Tax=Roridomyces roridus TaxID=1738132 RepID=A0AAD7C1T0_9AGAR|nr:hypothetical protein FB45DRAFT_482069 [Roridomyces roridus]
MHPKPPPVVKGQLSPQEDERRCEEVAALLLQGKKGEELAWAHSHSGSPDPDAPASFHVSNKFPSPLTLDPMFFPHSSPPSSSLASSGAGSPYPLPMPLGHGNDPTWRHRRSSSVPLPNDYAYNFPPFMQTEENTLPPLGFNAQQQYQYSFPPPPPSSNDDSLAGMPLSISGADRLPSFSWMTGGASTGTSTFSYPRPSFSFGGAYGTGARGSFSFAAAGAFGGVWPGGANGSPVGRRASSAQAYFSPSAYPSPQQTQSQQEEAVEELPDADTSLFEAGFLNSFGASAGSPATTASAGESVSPFDEQPMLHAPQPVHPISPLGAPEFDGEQHQQQQQVYEETFTGYATGHNSPQQQLEAEADVGLDLGYPHQGFEFPGDDAPLDFVHHHGHGASSSPAMTETYVDSEMAAYDANSYASEFV